MSRNFFLSLFVLATLLTSDYVWAEAPLIPAQTITSKLEMVVYVDTGEGFDKIGTTPGTVESPQCIRRFFVPTGLTDENVTAYKKELSRLGIRSVGLGGIINAGLKTYADVGLFTNLTSLYLGHCESLTDITPLAKLQNLTLLDLSDCESLTDIAPLAKLQKLTTLDLSDCDKLTDIAPLAKLQKLTTLDLSDCDKLTDIKSLAKLQNLTSLDLSYCNRLTDITPLTNLQNLTSLNLGGGDILFGGGTDLTDIAPLAALRKLTVLNLRSCKKIRDLQPLAWLPDLVALDLGECSKIKSFYPISGHKKLQKLIVTIPNNDLAFLRNLQQLKELQLSNCPRLSNLEPLARLRKLTTLHFHRCKLVTQEKVDALKKKLPYCSIGQE